MKLVFKELSVTFIQTEEVNISVVSADSFPLWYVDSAFFSCFASLVTLFRNLIDESLGSIRRLFRLGGLRFSS